MPIIIINSHLMSPLIDYWILRIEKKYGPWMQSKPNSLNFRNKCKCSCGHRFDVQGIYTVTKLFNSYSSTPVLTPVLKCCCYILEWWHTSFSNGDAFPHPDQRASGRHGCCGGFPSAGHEQGQRHFCLRGCYCYLQGAAVSYSPVWILSLNCN